MVDCVQIMRANSQVFIYNLKKTDFTLKKATKGFLLENDGCILCLETTDVDVTRVLLAQVLINLEEDTILNDKYLNEILFTDFISFATMISEQNEDFLKNFPDLLICILDNDNEEELSKQSHILESWISIIKLKGKKIIFIMKNPKHLEKIIMDNQMANIFKLKLDKLWKKNEILSTNEAICEIENNLVNTESTSARALDECMNINLKEEESSGKTALHGEEEAENVDLKKLLQSLGVKKLDAVNKKGDTLLHLAAYKGKTEIVESFLLHGAKKDIKHYYGKTALHFAAQKGHRAIVQMLLEHGFNVNATDNNYQFTPLHYASSYHNDAHLIEIVLKFDAETERKDKYGQTALHWASLNGRTAGVNSLLKNGANINAQTNYGNTPLHFATSNNKQKVVLILLQHGALLNIKNKQQQNALDFAKKLNRNKIIKILENHK